MAEVNIERRPDLRAELGYVCPECEAWSPIALWKETEVGCEDCGSHEALRCPLCDEVIDTVFTSFEDADGFLKGEERERYMRDGPTAEQRAEMLGKQLAEVRREVEHLNLFLSAADARAKQAQAEATIARREANTMRAAWLNAVGDRLLFRADLIKGLAEATTDMRLQLEELDEKAAGSTLAAMEAEYGPFVATVTDDEED